MAFRRLLRPSSASGAKASTVRSSILDLLQILTLELFLTLILPFSYLIKFVSDLLSYYLFFLTIQKDNIYLLFGFQRTISLRELFVP